jgi:hypothetical protein
MTAHDQISTPDGVVTFAAEWFDVFVSPPLASSIANYAKSLDNRWETAAGPVCFVKNLLLEAGYFKPSGHVFDDSLVTAVLHFGFIFIRETPEMVEMLRNEPPSEPSLARSRFANEVLVRAVSPIDGTAGRVSPGDAK